MSTMTYRRAVLVALGLVLLVSGCGPASARSARSAASASSGSATASPSVSRLDGCAPADARVTRLSERHMPPLPVLQLGGGSRAVVLADESDLDLCAWLPFARRLVRAGYRAVLFDYQLPVDDTVAVVRYLRAHGARSVALVGASQGAKISIVVGSRAGVRVDAVVSLSAESTLAGVGDVLPYARRLRMPVLFVTAAQDPYDATDATRAFEHAAPARHRRLVVVPGDAHGVALLHTAEVDTAVLDWLRSYAR